MKNTAILVTTFLRDECLFRCIESIRKYYPDIPIYIGDNGRPSSKKEYFYQDYNCTYLQLPFDCGVGGTRNEAIRRLPKDIRFLVVVEDDCIFTDSTILENWYGILQKDPKIGIVGGLLKNEGDKEQHYEGYHRIEGNTKFADKAVNPRWHKAGSAKFFYCDLVLNVFMMRLAMWRGGSAVCRDAIRWDSQFKTALEHADFFITAKYNIVKGKTVRRRKAWRIAYTPDVWMYHKHDCASVSDREYRRFRDRSVGFDLFGKKWGISYSFSDYNSQNPIVYKKSEKGKPDFDVKDFILKTAIEILDKHKIRWWLMSGTCLGAIREGDFIAHDTDIDIGIAPGQEEYWDVIIEEFADRNFHLYKDWYYKDKKIELTFKKYGIKIDFFFYKPKPKNKSRFWYGAFGPDRFGRWGDYMDFYPRSVPKRLFSRLKKIEFRGMDCYVPNPPEQFLDAIYGPNWQRPNSRWKYWIDCKALDKDLIDRQITVFIFNTWETVDAKFLKEVRKLGNTLCVGILSKPSETFNIRYDSIKQLNFVNQVIEINSAAFARDLQKLSFMPNYYVSYNGEDSGSLEYLRTFGCEIVPAVNIEKRMITIPRRVKREEKIAVGIKTFMREENLFRTIDAVQKNFPYPYRFYVADDGDISDEKAQLYSELEKDGHKIIRLPFNAGISIGRNAIVQEAKEDYILIMDDDIGIENPQAIKNMKTILDSADDIGIVAGVLRHEISNEAFGNESYSRGIDIGIVDGVIFRDAGCSEIYTIDGITCRQSDQVINFFLAKREVFDSVQWDNAIKVEWEHMDFFIEFMKTPWRSMICLDAPAVHLRSVDDYNYAYYRRRAPANYFCKKHGLGIKNGAPTIVNRWATERRQWQIAR